MSANQGLVDGVLACLDNFCAASSVLWSVSNKTDYWWVGLNALSNWNLAAWTHIWPGVIVRYLGILFGVGFVTCSHVGLLSSKASEHTSHLAP